MFIFTSTECHEISRLAFYFAFCRVEAISPFAFTPQRFLPFRRRLSRLAAFAVTCQPANRRHSEGWPASFAAEAGWASRQGQLAGHTGLAPPALDTAAGRHAKRLRQNTRAIFATMLR
jgi:hypothetical protein